MIISTYLSVCIKLLCTLIVDKYNLNMNVISLSTVPKKRAKEDYAPLSEGQEAHWEVRTVTNIFPERVFG